MTRLLRLACRLIGHGPMSVHTMTPLTGRCGWCHQTITRRSL